MHQLHLPTNVVCCDYIIAAVKICTSLAEHPIVQDVNNRIDVGGTVAHGNFFDRVHNFDWATQWMQGSAVQGSPQSVTGIYLRASSGSRGKRGGF